MSLYILLHFIVDCSRKKVNFFIIWRIFVLLLIITFHRIINRLRLLSEGKVLIRDVTQSCLWPGLWSIDMVQYDNVKWLYLFYNLHDNFIAIIDMVNKYDYEITNLTIIFSTE